MSKSNKSTVESNNAVESKNDNVAPMTYDEAVLLVPAKEHRTFTPEDVTAVAALKFPETEGEIKAMAKGLTHNQIFALCVVSGSAECKRVAKVFLADGVVLKPSAAASFKSVEKGTTQFFAGKTAYGLISAIK